MNTHLGEIGDLYCLKFLLSTAVGAWSSGCFLRRSSPIFQGSCAEGVGTFSSEFSGADGFPVKAWVSIALFLWHLLRPVGGVL